MNMDVYNVGKILHIVGVLLVSGALGALVLHALNGGSHESNRSRKLIGAMSGIGLLVILLSGLHMVGMLKVGFPLWVWLKVAVWLAVGALPVLIRRKPQHAKTLWVAFLLLATAATYLCLFKPEG